jgi:hypothetical protein
MIRNFKTWSVYYKPEIGAHTLEEGILYVSTIHGFTIHLCPCGCKKERLIELDNGYSDAYSFNTIYNSTCGSRYRIHKNEVEWINYPNM